ncbi:hypothetical protein SODALDRAFT_363176 [Sodiomyces alkalinus F11]|uniref:Uncharacterized protein n=1 Tax=Sodiomyces alkalinus (strain CBS 110278 / VKM F-3762 / F11) TaxID=1314773 RepID=A0A3N2PLF8_SODAK|nr:hypothetical protein SODALDRAFT_363176 [Sodiomyces alkalinus F11]ROT35357.1 hypothetical protein SODALDRAFT_363176 [Sodiomyces alkalinus F11]
MTPYTLPLTFDLLIVRLGPQFALPSGRTTLAEVAPSLTYHGCPCAGGASSLTIASTLEHELEGIQQDGNFWHFPRTYVQHDDSQLHILERQGRADMTDAVHNYLTLRYKAWAKEMVGRYSLLITGRRGGTAPGKVLDEMAVGRYKGAMPQPFVTLDQVNVNEKAEPSDWVDKSLGSGGQAGHGFTRDNSKAALNAPCLRAVWMVRHQ